MPHRKYHCALSNITYIRVFLRCCHAIKGHCALFFLFEVFERIYLVLLIIKVPWFNFFFNSDFLYVWFFSSLFTDFAFFGIYFPGLTQNLRSSALMLKKRKQGTYMGFLNLNRICTWHEYLENVITPITMKADEMCGSRSKDQPRGQFDKAMSRFRVIFLKS